MKNTTKLVLDKREKALNATTAMVRLARLSNAIAFTFQVQIDASSQPENIRNRQVYHSTFLLGGYLYEAIKVIEDLKRHYCRRVCFAGLRQLHNDLVKNHDVLAEMNFNIGYHHEANDNSTRSVLRRMELPIAELKRSALAPAPHLTYYPTAYMVDSNVLFDSLVGLMTKQQIAKYVRNDLDRIARRFLRVSETFIKEMSRQMLKQRNSNRGH
jgi:hypothetical protein